MEITFNGLADLPGVKADLNRWIDNLRHSVNCDTGHLSDRASIICNYAKLLDDKGKEIFEIFNKQKQS